MSKIYILSKGFIPNTASTNRLLGLLKTASKMGRDIDVVFFISDAKRSKAPALPHITYHYYWGKFDINNNKIKLLLYRYLYSRKFISSLRKGDVVYTYGCNEMIHSLVGKKGIRVFHERTEHPLVSKLKLLNVDKYLRACTKLDGLFVISNPLRDYFISIGVPEGKIHIINMTVDPHRFVGLEKRVTERYIAYCGKATNNKDGVDRLIKAFAITSKTHPDVKLYIIGTPPKRSDESGNLELVESLGLKDSVVFTGIIQSEKIPQVLKDAEILALARPDNIQAKYGFPTKLGEYLLTENPVVITAVGDIPHFLKDNFSAMIAQPDSLEEFAEKMNYLLDNKVEAAKIGQRGKEVAITHFDIISESTKILNLLFQ